VTCGPRRILVAVTGASGVVYGVRLVQVLLEKGVSVDAVVTRAARRISVYEEGYDVADKLASMGVRVYGEDEIDAPYASSSSAPDAMVVAPCSTRTLAAVAHGLADNLVTRAALAVLRLRRPLVLVVRETPLGLAEIENMLRAARAGAVILPACPAFYHRPRSVQDMVDFVVGKVLDVLGLEHNLYRRWGGVGYSSSSSGP
jgi:4-hydroxy-3-polyprenylbenzoate decarboxylase